MISHCWVILTIIIETALISTQNVRLSIENYTQSEYIGHVWSNSRFVFLKPYLKADVIEKSGTSKKICGFELTSPQFKSVPFIVYLVDEVSGLGEIQIKPDFDSYGTKEKTILLEVEAYDCDEMPHYSNRSNVVVHISNLAGPKFERKAYSFSINKAAPIDTVVGKVRATGSHNATVSYSLYNSGNAYFGLDKSGTIVTLSALTTIVSSLVYLRVVATEQSGSLATQSMASVAIEIEAICENKLVGIPDQLDYKTNTLPTGQFVKERIIQDQRQLRVLICDKSTPIKIVRLRLSLKPSGLPQSLEYCHVDIAANQIHRGVCRINPGAINLFPLQGGIIDINDWAKSLGPELLPYQGGEFTIGWWMRSNIAEPTTIFCFQNKDMEDVISLLVAHCRFIISISGRKEIIEFPASACRQNSWTFYSLSLKNRFRPSLEITVAEHILPSIPIDKNIFPSIDLRLFVGKCVSPVVALGSKPSNQKNHIEIGVVWYSGDESLSPESIGCMSVCGEALLVSDFAKPLQNALQNPPGSSLEFTVASVPETLKILSNIYYANSHVLFSRDDQTIEKRLTNIIVELSVRFKSGQAITFPTSLIRVNILYPQRDSTNDTIDVDIYASSTVLATKSQSVRLCPDFRFMNSITEDPIKRTTALESCSIRPLRGSFVSGEKIYLDDLVVPICLQYNLKVKSDSTSWTLEGSGDAELYEQLLKYVRFIVANDRRQLVISCTLKGGELTSQAVVEILVTGEKKIAISNEENLADYLHNSMDERKQMNEEVERQFSNYFNISKRNFAVVVLMAVVVGAILTMVAIAMAWAIIRKRKLVMNRGRFKVNEFKAFERGSSPEYGMRATTTSYPLSICNPYECDDDRTSMADIPETGEHCEDNVSCDTCSIDDQDNTNVTREFPRSKTVNFPIMHTRF